EPDRRERFRTGGEVTTAADGRFGLRVHPGMAWTVVVRPGAVRTHAVRRDGIAAGTTDLRVVVGDGELRGCTITGTVHAPGGGAAPACELWLTDVDPGVLVHGHQPLDAVWDGACFRLPVLGTGRDVELDVVPSAGSGL